VTAPDIFLSYNREDQAVASRYAEAFAAEGLNVWWDTALRSGEAYDEVTEAALRAAKAVVVLWSPRSVVSRWVRAEATIADRCKTLVPVTIEPCERPIMFELTQTAELSHWQGDASDKAWRAFLGDVRGFVGRGAPVAAIATPSIEVPEPPPAKSGERGSAPSLAVMPFTNRSGLPEDEVFAEGMVEDVISALSQGAFVRVLGSMATANLRRDTISDPAAVGRQLGVRYLLEGNVRRVGASLRVTTQLIEAAHGEVLWASRFDRPLSELAALQEELVHEVAGSLDTQVMNQEVVRVLKKPGDLTAWEAAMRSVSYTNHLDAAGLAKGIEEGRRAVSIDPDYALGHAAIANSSSVLYLLASIDDPAQVKAIRRHIDRAMELAPDDPFVLTYAGGALLWTGQLTEALRPLSRAIAKMPGNGLAQYSYAAACSFLDRTEEAFEHASLAFRLMSGSLNLWTVLAMQANTLIRVGRWEDAISRLDESLILNPDGSIIRLQHAICYRHFGRDDEARATFERVRSDGWTLAQMEVWFRRVMGNNPVLGEHLDSIRALWAETEDAP
jgi:TolB-like protein/Flp pilus assembly protein TadD